MNNSRIQYLQKLKTTTKKQCPECGHELINDEYEIYCESCGLIVSATIEYVAGVRIFLPYGRM